MSVVQRLPDLLANKIAAGEVVERPAAVVKELVENAVDAQATRIDVAIREGGRALIEVVDDGSGMSRQDALLSLERHTTSKISNAEDLFAIRTFGFRGEALASIASVSRFTMTTRRAEDVAATRISVEGGRILSVEEVGAPAGTRIEVADLFFNVPARLKFLRAKGTEAGHIADWFTRVALARHDVSFSLSSEGRSQVKADATPDMRERIARVLTRELYDLVYPVELTDGDVRVWGYVAGPGRQTSTNREIFTYVNGRYVRDRSLLHTVSRAYDGVLQVGRSPTVVLFIELPPDLVDVNVHPQKLEVRFVNQRSVTEPLYQGIRETLSGSPWLKNRAPTRTYALDPLASSSSEVPEPSPSNDARPPVDGVDSGTEQSEAGGLGWNAVGETPLQRKLAAALRSAVQQTSLDVDAPLWARDRNADDLLRESALPGEGASQSEAARPLDLERKPAETTDFKFSALRYLAQIQQTYLVCESNDGLVLIDQHAAHERVLYERMRAERAGASTKGQPFLVPMTLEFSVGDARLVESTLEELDDLGFELEPFGGSTFVLKAAPAELKGADFARVVCELAAEIRAHGQGDSATASEEALLVRMSCHAAVRAGDALEPVEALRLLRDLDGTPFQAQCPHGRPVAVRFETKMLEELFKRTYEGTPAVAKRDRLLR